MNAFRSAAGRLVLVSACLVVLAAAPAFTAPRPDEAAQLREALAGLEHGIAALDRLGYERASAQLREIAVEVRGRIERAQRERGETGSAEPPSRPAGADQGRRDLETMELAVHALAEAGRDDGAELLRRALRARAVQLEGVQGSEARAAAQRAPDPRAQIELLAKAAELWGEFGHPDRAEAVADLAHRMERRMEAASKPARGPDADAFQRLEHISAKLAELERAVADLRRELQQRAGSR